MPALACDHELYDPLRAALDRLAQSNQANQSNEFEAVRAAARELAAAEYLSVHYGAAQPGEALSAYAARQVFEQHSGGLDCDLVIGTSFGGMCAQAAIEAGVARSPALVLISTCFSGNDLQPWLLLFRRFFPLLAYLPRWTRRLALRTAAWLFPIVRRGIPNPQRFRAMTNRANLSYLFESGRMIAQWRAADAAGRSPRQLPEQTFFAHGCRDPVISFARVAAKRAPDAALADGDHILILTRANWLAREIAGWWASLAANS